MKIESTIRSDLRKCRLCFEDEKVLLYIFEVSGSLKNIARTVCEVLNYEVAVDDQFPPFVCSDCSDKLHGFKCFKEKCDRLRETYELFLKTKRESTSDKKLILWGVKKEEKSDVVLKDVVDNSPLPHSAETYPISVKADEEEIEIPVGYEDFIVRAFPIQAVDNTGNLDPLADSEEDDLNADNDYKEVCDEEEVDLPCDEIPFIVSAFPVEANKSSDNAEEEISDPVGVPLEEEGRKLRPRKQTDYALDRQSPGLGFDSSESSDYILSEDDSRSSSDESYSTRRNTSKVSFTGEVRSHHPEGFEKSLERVQLEANSQFKRSFHNWVERLRKECRDDSFFDSEVLECARVVDQQDVNRRNRNNVTIAETQDNAPSPASSKGSSGTVADADNAEHDIPGNAKTSQGDSGSGNQSNPVPSKLKEYLSNTNNSVIPNPCETAVVGDGKECVEGSPLDGSATVSGGDRSDRLPLVDGVPIGLQQDCILRLNHSNWLKASTGFSSLPSNNQTYASSAHAKLPEVIRGAEEEGEHVVLAHDAKGLETSEKTCRRRTNLGIFVRSILKSSVVKDKDGLGKESVSPVDDMSTSTQVCKSRCKEIRYISILKSCVVKDKEESGKETRHPSPANVVSSKLTSSDDDTAAEAVCDDSDSGKSDENTSEFSEDDLGDERELEAKRDYLCHLCGKVYGLSSSLYTHMKTHDEKLPFACEKCPKTFKNKYALEVHMHVHFDKRLFKCDKCPKSFKTKLHLQQHGISHTGKRKYPCAHCEESFRTRWQFALHQKTHEGKVQWGCDCGEECVSWEELVKHQAEHKRNRSWKCEHCSKLFNKKELLVRHIHIHTKPFVCSTCGKGFATAQLMRNHIVAHSGKKRHRCDLCGMKFQNRSGMVKHRKIIHSEVARFKCRFCNFRSKYKFEWKKHERTKHAEEVNESDL